jgi:glyoxalase-like protein
VDHLVLATPDLAGTVAWFAAATGVTPQAGGRHVGLGTANSLVGLGGGAYLEIVGPDPEQPAPAQPRPLRVDDVAGPQLVTWALRPADLDALREAARIAGYDPGPPGAMSRRTAAGTLLRWRLTPFTFDLGGGLVPFLIDWGATTHPTAGQLPQVELLDLHATSPDLARVSAALAALDAELAVDPGPDVTLHAAVRGPGGVARL